MKTSSLKRKSYMKRSPLRKISAKKARKDRVYPKLREKVSERAGYCCERCGKWAPLEGHELLAGQLHHKVYRSHGGEHTMENSEWLCPDCHRMEHEGGKPDKQERGKHERL